MGSWRGQAALVLLAATVAACDSAHSAPGAGAPPASGASYMTVSARIAQRVPCLGPERPPAGVPVSAGFVAVAAIRCIQADQEVPGHGLWQFELWQVAHQGLAKLATALRRPAVRPPSGLLCAEPGFSVPPFVLRGSNGDTIYPKLPADECGNPQPQVLAAVRALVWVTVASRRGIQVATQAGVRSGCPAGWKDMIGFTGSFDHGRSLHASAGGQVFQPRPQALRVCIYRDRSGPLDTYLVGGSRISAAAETTLLTGIAAGRSSATCPQPHTMFAVLLPSGMSSQPAYVELGGCHRVLRPDNRIGQATPAALAIIARAQRG